MCLTEQKDKWIFATAKIFSRNFCYEKRTSAPNDAIPPVVSDATDVDEK